jgi:hypothetical protein
LCFYVAAPDIQQHLFTVRESVCSVELALQLEIMNKLLIGSTEKTNFLLQFLAEKFPSGVTLIDPTGDIARAAAQTVPIGLTQKTMYFDPSDIGHPVGFNVLEGVPKDDHQLFADQFCAYFDTTFTAGRDTIARSNARYILANCIRVLLETPKATLLGLQQFLTDSAYRINAMSFCTDTFVFDNISSIWEDKEYKSGIALLTNHVGTLLMSPVMRNIVGQETSTMYGATIILANLDRSKIGDLTAKLLGGLLIARSSGKVFVNDFPFFASDKFPFAQDRFTVSLDFLDQVSRKLQQDLLGIEDKVVLQTNPADAERFAFYVNASNARMLVDLGPDQARTPYSDRPIHADPPKPFRKLKALQNRTRSVHTRPRKQVEATIAKVFA